MDEEKGIWKKLTDWERSPLYKYLLKVRVKRYVVKGRLYDNEQGGKLREVEKLGKKAVPGLIEGLKCMEGGVWVDISNALAKIGKTAVPALKKALRYEKNPVGCTVANALGKIGKPAVPMLIEALKDKDANVRVNAAEALGKIGDASAVPMLIEVLSDRNEYVRKQAAYTFGEIVKKCKTLEEVGEVEKRIEQSSVALRKGRPNKTMLIKAQIEIASVTREIAKKKDELAPKRDLLLDDKPKPPKKGRGVYHTTRRVRNG